MANTINKNTAPVNVKRMVVFYNDGETEKTFDFSERIMTYKDTISSNSEPLCGGGEVRDIAYGMSSGNLELGIFELTNEERKVLYGEKVVKGANVTTGAISPDYVGVAVLVERNDGTVNLHKWFKVKFAPNDEDVTQISDGKKTFSTITLKGTYIKDGENGYRATQRQIDPTEKATVVSSWFSEREYIGEGSV